MARNRTRWFWTRERQAAAEPDAPFFEDAAKWRPRPDSPEVSLFTPAEEAESHRRWRRAMLRERLRGPVTEAERLGLGLSAAALAALAAAERQSREGAEFDEQRDDGSGDVGEVLRATEIGRRQPGREGAGHLQGRAWAGAGLRGRHRRGNGGFQRGCQPDRQRPFRATARAARKRITVGEPGCGGGERARRRRRCSAPQARVGLERRQVAASQ